VELRKNTDCIAAISVTNLYDVYDTPDKHVWLRQMKPIAKWLFVLRFRFKKRQGK